MGPGRHTLTTLNIPFLVSYLKIPFGSKSPFRAEVVFVNLKDYLDQAWSTPHPLPFRDPDLGMVRLTTEGKFAFHVGQAQQFVNQVVGTQGLYGTKDIIAYLRSILTTRLTDVLGKLRASVLDLPTRYDELSAAVRAKTAVDFEALGLAVKAVYITSIGVPPEVEKAMDERASMGAIGNMQAYLQFKAARAIGSALSGATPAGAAGSAAPTGSQPPAGAGGLGELFGVLTGLVQQQVVLGADDRNAAAAGLNSLLALLSASAGSLDEFRTARLALTSRFPWLVEPLNNVLNSPAGRQALGRITARTFYAGLGQSQRMSNTPRLNWVLFAGFLLVALAVTAAALVLPAFRPLAYAPLRELVLPPPAPIVVSLLYSTEKEQWLAEVVPAFEAGHPQINGHPLEVKLEKSGSREMILAVLNGQAKPDLISPASSLKISILQDQSVNVFGHSIVNPADTQNCRPVLRTPLVMVAWKERADVLWGR